MIRPLTRRELLRFGAPGLLAGKLAGRGAGGAGACVSWLHNRSCVIGQGLLAYYDFRPGPDPRVLYDRGGRGVNLNFGGVPGSSATANDPSWVAGGLSFMTDDFISSAANGPYRLTAEFTIQLAATPGASVREQDLVMQPNHDHGGVDWGVMYTSGNFSLATNYYSGTTPRTGSFIASPVGTPVMCGWSHSRAALTCLMAKGSTFLPWANDANGAFGVAGNMAFYLGQSGYAAYYANLTCHALLIYNRALSAAEMVHNYTAVKAELARRGVTL